MDIFEDLASKHYEQLCFCYDAGSGLKAIISIHDTTLGPALGGCRMQPYASTEDAVRDVLRLSRGMTFKSAAAGLNLGGGKSVIIGDPKRLRADKTAREQVFRAFGRYIEGLGGRYITAEDVGTDVRAMEWVRMETNWVVGISRALGGSGDPSPVTALGTFAGMKAAAKERWGNDSLEGKHVTVQGVGAVGHHLVRLVKEAGAKVTVCDVDADNLARVTRDHQVDVVEPDAIFDVPADIFAPCALGAVVNEKTIPRLKVEVIAGSANNILEKEERDSAALIDKDILYAPDYVVNAGGLINVANELEGYNQQRALNQAEGIYDIVLKIFAIAKEKKISTLRAADELALQRLSAIGRLRGVYTPSSNARSTRKIHGVS